MKSYRILLSTALFSSLLILSACSSKNAGSKDGELGSDVDGMGISESELSARREGRFGSGSIPAAEGEGPFRDVHFDYDSASIDDTGRQDIEFNARVLQDNPNLSISLEGHCDARGTNEYNMALGAERAKSVRSALSALGVSSNRMDTISYGEEVPLDSSSSEEAYAQNRRVHLSASEGRSASIGSRSQY
jgi:peptidoglycan-associated lipoprotein